MEDSIHIELLDPSQRCKVVRERPSAHGLDTSFESRWPMADGYLKKIRLKPGLDIYVMDWSPGIGFTMNAAVRHAGFGFKFFISGKMKYQNSAVNGDMFMAAGLNRFAFFPASGGSGQCMSKDRVKVVIISMAPSLFLSLFQDARSRLLSALPVPALNKAFFHISPNTPAMETAALDIFNCTFHGSLKKVFLEGKALELAACQLHGLIPSRQPARLSGQERDKVQAAREILVRHIDAPPTFLALAGMVGMPHNRLSMGFHAMYGATPFALLRDLRLEKSRTLLKSQTGNVTQVAMDVGYASLSHFAKAFKKKYGISPKQYQLNKGA
nr:AraC family transcriptional regulator [uncultured Desulfobacter sp.]